MSEIKIGDRVICINNQPIDGRLKVPPLQQDAPYIVMGIRICECGGKTFNVGIYSQSCVTCKCGAKSSPFSGIWWCNSKRFKKDEIISSEEERLAQLQEAIDNDDFETAIKLRDQK